MYSGATITIIACAAVGVLIPGSASGSPLSARAGGVVEFFQDRDGWMSAGGAFTSVDFTGLDEFTILSDQYENLGLLFPDHNDSIVRRSSYSDGYGVYGGGFGEDGITTVFSQPKFWIAVDYPGRIVFRLFRKGELVYESSNHHSGGEIAFFGLVSDEPFDTAFIFDPTFDTFIDNLFFGPPCSVDLDGGGDVDFADVLWLLRAWGECPTGQRCAEDLDGSGRIDFGDILTVLSAWGPCPSAE